jgi:predicted kinase
VWFTGLSGAGKTTLAGALEHRLHRRGIHTFLLDADAVRRRLNADLGFSAEDRRENLRRFTEVACLFADAGVLTLVAAITPYESVRNEARERVGASRFVLVHVAIPRASTPEPVPESSGSSRGSTRPTRSRARPTFASAPRTVTRTRRPTVSWRSSSTVP